MARIVKVGLIVTFILGTLVACNTPEPTKEEMQKAHDQEAQQQLSAGDIDTSGR